MKQLEKVVKLIRASDLDGVILMSDVNRFWFTTFPSSAGYIFINREGKTAMLIDGRYFISAKANAKNIQEFHLLDPILTNKTVVEQIEEILKQLKMVKVGLEKEYTTLADVELFQRIKGISLLSFGSVSLREVKEPSEIEALQRAADIAADTIEWMKTQVKPGMTEREIATMISVHMLEMGADKNSFEPIVASGLNGASPHHHPGDKKVEMGEMITLDIGCIYRGYCSDITRSFVLGGKANNPEIEQIYDIVLKAQTSGIKAATTAATGAEIDQLCRKIIGETKYKDYFTHATGHGVGIEVHELPTVSRNNHKKLIPNNVVTVEPGIYVPGVGGVRIEDTILITDGEPIVLTRRATK